ncbi:MAG: hypothetical protein AAF637_06220 [Pseudomonadota bacterium]
MNWWDTERKETRRSFLPARQVEVRANPDLQSATSTKTTSDPKPVVQTASSGQPSLSGLYNARDWFWPLASLLLLSGWLITLALWYRSAQRLSRIGKDNMARTGNPREAGIKLALGELESACAANDAKAAHRATLALAEATWPDERFNGAPKLCQKLGEGQVSAAIAALERALYGPQGGTADGWNSDSYWHTLSAGLEMADTNRGPEQLIAPLHPGRSA